MDSDSNKILLERPLRGIVLRKLYSCQSLNFFERAYLWFNRLLRINLLMRSLKKMAFAFLGVIEAKLSNLA